jgi:hypothetical protein
LLFLAYVWGFTGIPTAFVVDVMLYHVGVGVRECVRACVRVALEKEKKNTYTILMGEI